MSFMEMGRSLGQPVDPNTYGVYRVIRPVSPPGAREGSFSVPVQGKQFDRRMPIVQVSEWTPWGWQSPLPGSAMERF